MFPSPDLGKVSFQSNAEKRFLVPQTSTGIGSIGSRSSTG